MAKAAHDLVAARATIATGEALDTVCFHSQQAAEQTLKALLAIKDVQYPWRHDMGELLELLRIHHPNLEMPTEELLKLSPYAVEARYDGIWTPDIEEARNALALAEQMHALILPLTNKSGV
jgi:HEPN domain-containing protein